MKQSTPLTLGMLSIFFAVLLFPFFGELYLGMDGSHTQIVIENKLNKEEGCKDQLSYNLLDPEQSPNGIHDTVMLGFHIMTDTPNYAPDILGNELSCTNCHFSAGNTTGGKNGSISLAGVAAAYPLFNEHSGEVITLAERINGCVKRSMNGKPMNLNSRDMNAIITYLHWISKNFPIYQPVPWRGLQMIESRREPDPENGEKIFQAQCALCHGEQGEGGVRIPPLWGPKSFNDGAGMNNIDTFAAFIYANMPYEQPSLTQEEAFDVASFVTQQPRPGYEN